MSMEISGNYKDYKNEYLERAQTEQDKVKRTSQEQRAEDKSEGGSNSKGRVYQQ